MNQLLEFDPDHTEESAIIVKDKMLSTLDMSLRKSTLPNGREYLLVDTVGFVSDLPCVMKDAFKSTFEELGYADLILTVYDISSEGLALQKKVMEDTMRSIGITKKKNISVYNKSDKLDKIPNSTDKNIFISAKSGYNLNKLLQLIQDTLFEDETEATLLIPYAKFEIFNEIKDNRIIELEDFTLTNIGIELHIVLTKKEFEKYKDYIKSNF